MASFDTGLLRSVGVEVLQTLWGHDISAELAKDARSPEDLLQKHRDESYHWIVIIKPESMLKIKTIGRKDVADVDIQVSQLLAWLRPQLRGREGKMLSRMRGTNSQGGESSTPTADKDQEQIVKVLVAQTRSKKFNRRTVVEQALSNAAALVNGFLEGPILAVETTDQALELIRETRLSDNDSWKRVDHGVTKQEKQYVRDIQDQLATWRFSYEKKNGTRHSFLYNFRTGMCLYYDLGA